MTHLPATREDLPALAEGHIIRFAVTDNEGAKQGEAIAQVLSLGTNPKVRYPCASEEAFQFWISSAGEVDHAPKKAKTHVCRLAPSRCPLNVEISETQHLSRWAYPSRKDARDLARKWKYPLKKLPLVFLDPPEDPTDDGEGESEEEEAE